MQLAMWVNSRNERKRWCLYDNCSMHCRNECHECQDNKCWQLFPRCRIRFDVPAIYRHRQFLLRAQARPGDRNRRLWIRNRNLHLHVLRSVSDPELRLEGLVLDYLGDNPPRDLVRHGVQAARGRETQTAPPCYIIRWHSSEYRLNGWFFIKVGR